MLESNDKICVDELGQHQLSLIGNVFVNSYISKTILPTQNESLLQSTIVYNNFVEWCKENKICDKRFDYFTQTRFTQLLGQQFIQKRISDGKFWKNITFNDNKNIVNYSIAERLYSCIWSNISNRAAVRD